MRSKFWAILLTGVLAGLFSSFASASDLPEQRNFSLSAEQSKVIFGSAICVVAVQTGYNRRFVRNYFEVASVICDGKQTQLGGFVSLSIEGDYKAMRTEMIRTALLAQILQMGFIVDSCSSEPSVNRVACVVVKQQFTTKK